MPNLIVMRPGDANEVTERGRYRAVQHQPVALVLTRQAMPTFDREVRRGIRNGAWSLCSGDRAGGKPDVILMARAARLRCVDATKNESGSIKGRV